MNGPTPFFRPGGTMDPSAPSYIERSADGQLFEALARGEYVFLLDSRQKGKSSMVARAIVKLRERGITTVKLDLQRLGSNVTPEQWYAGLIGEIGAELGLTNDLFQYWGDRTAVGPLARWIGALKDVVLKKTTAPLVVFIDEIDFVRALPFSSDEFFAGIRDCFNRRSEIEAFRRLSFCLVGVATPGQLIRNPEITPFNIGSRIEVSDFTIEESKPFGQALSVDSRDGGKLLERVHFWLSGHPYLTQLLCSRIAADSSIVDCRGVDALVRELFLTPESRQREPNFADVERRILDPDVPGHSPEEKRTQVLELYGKLLKGRRVEAQEENPVVATLRLSGVGLEDRSALRVRNRLYGRVFDEKWRQNSLPEAEMRRQRGAARLALLRTATVAGVVLLGVTTVAVSIAKLSNEKSKVLTELGRKSKDLERTSDERKSAFDTLQGKNQELSRVSSKHQEALERLRKSSGQLEVVSQERLYAIASLGDRNKELKTTAEERRKALDELKVKSESLKLESYAGVMSSIQLAVSQNRWAEVGELLEKTRQDPNRGWEWGHMKMLTGAPIVEHQFAMPGQSYCPPDIETQPDGSLAVATADGLYAIKPTGTTLIRKFRGPMIRPHTRRGNIRFGFDLKTNIIVIRDSESDAILGEISDYYLNVLDFNPVDRTLATSGGQKFEGFCYQIRSLDGKRVLASYKGPAAANQAVFLPDGTVFSRDTNGLICRRDRDGNLLATSQLSANVGAHFSADRTHFALFELASRKLEIRRSSDFEIVATLNDIAEPSVIRLYPAQSRVLLSTRESSLKLYDFRAGTIISTFRGHSDWLHDASYLSDDMIASVDRSGGLKIWRVSALPAIETIERKDDPVSGAWFEVGEPDVLLMLSRNGSWVSRDMNTGIESRLGQAGYKLPTTSFGKYLYVGHPNGTVEQLLAHGLVARQTVKVSNVAASRLLISEGGNRLVVQYNPPPGGLHFEYVVLDAETMKVVSRFKYPWSSKDRSWPSVSLNHDGAVLALSINKFNLVDRIGAGNCEVHLFSTINGQVLGKIFRADAIHHIALSPDGQELFVVSNFIYQKARTSVYRVRDQKLMGEFAFPDKAIRITTLWTDPKGRFLLAGFNEREWMVFDIAARRVTARIGVGADLGYLDFSKDGSRAISSAVGLPPMIWDCRTGRALLALEDSLSNTGKNGSKVGRFVNGDRDVIVVTEEGSVRIYHSAPWKSQPNAASKKDR